MESWEEFVEDVVFNEVLVLVGVGNCVVEVGCSLMRVMLSMHGPIQGYKNILPTLKTESKQILLLLALATNPLDPLTTANSPKAVKLYNHFPSTSTSTVENDIVQPLTTVKFN